MSPSCSRLRLFIARDSLVDGEVLIFEIRGLCRGSGHNGKGRFAKIFGDRRRNNVQPLHAVVRSELQLMR
jgi:hypothetical protein